jgi:hypothetical protein
MLYDPEESTIAHQWVISWLTWCTLFPLWMVGRESLVTIIWEQVFPGQPFRLARES